MIDNRESVFHPYVRARMSKQNTLHIAQFFFKFFEEQDALKMYAQEEEIMELSCYVEPNKNFIRGPF